MIAQHATFEPVTYEPAPRRLGIIPAAAVPLITAAAGKFLSKKKKKKSKSAAPAPAKTPGWVWIALAGLGTLAVGTVIVLVARRR